MCGQKEEGDRGLKTSDWAYNFLQVLQGGPSDMRWNKPEKAAGENMALAILQICVQIWVLLCDLALVS